MKASWPLHKVDFVKDEKLRLKPGVGLANRFGCVTHLYPDQSLRVNNAIDIGKEMFSNSKVAEGYRGIASLQAVDANGDGVIDANDPVCAQMLVWQDKNSNGQLDGQANEVKTLSQLGISSLNYQAGTVTRNGAQAQMSTLTLEADTLGTSYTPKGDGVVLETTNGQISLQVRNLHTLERALAPPGLNVYSEGFATDQNVPVTIFVRGQSGFGGLLDNDGTRFSKENRCYEIYSYGSSPDLGCKHKTLENHDSDGKRRHFQTGN
jgi:hypothetical protein